MVGLVVVVIIMTRSKILHGRDVLGQMVWCGRGRRCTVPKSEQEGWATRMVGRRLCCVVSKYGGCNEVCLPSAGESR